MKPMFKRIFVIEGNIGAGKSTLLNLLEKSFQNIYAIYEPVDKWSNIAGTNLLANFYSSPERWGFTFELYSMFSKIKLLRNAMMSDAEIIIMERSILSDQVFQNISYNLEKIDIKELAILEEIRAFFFQDMPKIDGIIYLNTKPVDCLQRIRKRKRSEEQNVDINYLIQLEKEFAYVCYNKKHCIIDGDYDIKKPSQVIRTIQSFINNN
jgi:deoxyadenosine/deoxycytidine kinase